MKYKIYFIKNGKSLEKKKRKKILNNYYSCSHLL